MKRKLALIFISTFCFILMASCLVACNVVITSADFKTTNHTVDPFSSIDIDVDVSEIKLVKSADKTYAITCYETDKYYHKVSVENGTLKIKSVSALGVNLNIGWAKSPEITIYLSEDVYDSLKVSADTGNVSISEDITFNTIDISCDTGNVKMDTVNCSKLTVECGTGNVDLTDTVASVSMDIEVDTGNIRLSQCDAPTINLETSLGDIKGSLLTGKKFVAKSDLGDVNVPANDPTGGVCTIYTDLGNIDITIA